MTLSFMKLKTYLSERFSSVEHFIVGRAKLFLSKKAIFIFMKAAEGRCRPLFRTETAKGN
jgi:hypothetical protein